MSTITMSPALGRPAAPVAPAPAATSMSVRLTRRGRLLLSTSVLFGLVSAGVLATGGLPAIAGHEPGAAAAAERVTVRPGETLWEIARRTAPGTDPRQTVHEILQLNALDTAAVEAGSVLLVPAE